MMEPDVEDGDDSAAEAETQLDLAFVQDFCTWDRKDQAMPCATGISEPVSIADFKEKCLRHLESVESDAITQKVSSIPPGPVRDFGFTEMLGVSLDELKAVREECK